MITVQWWSNQYLHYFGKNSTLYCKVFPRVGRATERKFKLLHQTINTNSGPVAVVEIRNLRKTEFQKFRNKEK